MTNTNIQLIALIPTRESGLYDTFGLDIILPAEYDEDGDCIRDWMPVEWIEVCAYPTEDGETLELDPRSDSTIRDMLDEAAAKAGYGIRWGTYSETTTWEIPRGRGLLTDPTGPRLGGGPPFTERIDQ